MKVSPRPDKTGPQRKEFEANKRKILKTQTICGICGKPVDKSLKYPDPWSATIDHIIPVDKGGNPSAMDNLQLAHFYCNRQKSDKLMMKAEDGAKPKDKVINNRDLPLSMDWSHYKAQ